MATLRLTKAARKELDAIWEYIAQDNEEAADRLLRELFATSKRLAEKPGIGVSRAEYGRSLRSFPVRDYLIFYREIHDGIHVAHFVHGARDLPRFFKRRK